MLASLASCGPRPSLTINGNRLTNYHPPRPRAKPAHYSKKFYNDALLIPSRPLEEGLVSAEQTLFWGNLLISSLRSPPTILVPLPTTCKPVFVRTYKTINCRFSQNEK